MDRIANRPIFTIGHGTARFPEIEQLLEVHGVATLVDVRAVPDPEHASDFRKGDLEELTTAAGFGYRWMGDRLGRWPGSGVSTGAGPIGVESAAFRGALAEVVALNAAGPVALLCEERNPEHCHRRFVLAPHLENLGLDVFHILPDGAAHRHQPPLEI